MGSEYVCGYKLVRQLGTRGLPSYAAIDPKPRRADDALCVAEVFARKGGVGAEAAAEFLRDAKRLTQLKHPNVARVRGVVLGTSTVLVVMDWIDGETWSDLQATASQQSIPIPLAGSLRVVVDLLEGLSALHEVSDAKRERLQLVHAEIAPRNVVVGIDGRAVLVHPLHAPPGPTRSHSAEVSGYLAPEVLLGDQTADQRADVYGAGVMLWEALAGRRMHAAGDDPGEIVMRLLGGKVVPPPVPSDAPWAGALVEIATKAASPDPANRYPNATTMLTDVRRVAGARLAPKLTVAALVEAVAGSRIRERAKTLRRAASIVPSEGESAWTTEAPTVDRQGEAHVAKLLDAESAKPTPLKPPPMSDDPSLPAPSEASERHEEIEVEVDLPSPPPAEVAAAPKAAPAMEVAPAPPQPPLAAAPPSTSARSPFDTLETKTDLAAAVATVPQPPSKTAKWTIALACALGAVAIAWLALRPSDEASARSTDSTTRTPASARVETPPAANTAEAPSPGRAPAPPETATARAESEPDSPEDRATKPRAATPATPPIPTVTAPATPTAATPPATAPASSTRPKKRVYDPMGI